MRMWAALGVLILPAIGLAAIPQITTPKAKSVTPQNLKAMTDPILLDRAIRAQGNGIYLMNEMRDDDGTRFHYLVRAHQLVMGARYVLSRDGTYVFDSARWTPSVAMPFHQAVGQRYHQLTSPSQSAGAPTPDIPLALDRALRQVKRDGRQYRLGLFQPENMRLRDGREVQIHYRLLSNMTPLPAGFVIQPNGQLQLVADWAHFHEDKAAMGSDLARHLPVQIR